MNAQLKRRITDLYNFDKEMLQVLQSTPEPSNKAKKRHFGPPQTHESNRKSPKIHVERLMTERMQTPVSRRKTPEELQTAEPINLMR